MTKATSKDGEISKICWACRKYSYKRQVGRRGKGICTNDKSPNFNKEIWDNDVCDEIVEVMASYR